MLPIRCRSFVYRSSEFSGADRLQALIRRDLAGMLVDRLEYFQSFEHVKIYYDHGQAAVSRALGDAFEYALAKSATVRRESGYRSFRLSQVADFLCAIELTAEKYARHAATATDERFFGSERAFKKNWIKQERRQPLMREDEGLITPSSPFSCQKRLALLAEGADYRIWQAT